MEECVVSAVFKEELKVFYTQILNIKRSHVNVSYPVCETVEHERTPAGPHVGSERRRGNGVRDGTLSTTLNLHQKTRMLRRVWSRFFFLVGL